MSDFGMSDMGEYHDPELRYERVMDTARPYRMASWLNDAVIQYCSTSDYTVGRTERDDIAVDLISSTTERNGFTPEEAYEYLTHWRSIYNRGFDG